jgi:hypothetical protein
MKTALSHLGSRDRAAEPDATMAGEARVRTPLWTERERGRCFPQPGSLEWTTLTPRLDASWRIALPQTITATEEICSSIRRLMRLFQHARTFLAHPPGLAWWWPIARS